MPYILDIILLILFIVTIVVAAKKGFAKSLLEIIAFFLAIGLSFALSPLVAEPVYDGMVKDVLVEKVEEQMDKADFDVTETAEQVKEVVLSIPEPITRVTESFGIDIDKIVEKIDVDKIEENTSAPVLVDKIAKPIVMPVLNLLIFVILAIVLSIVLKIVADLISKVFKLPLIGTVNKALGGVLGVLKGLIIVCIICLLLKGICGGMDNVVGQIVDDSIIVKTVSNILVSLK